MVLLYLPARRNLKTAPGRNVTITTVGIEAQELQVRFTTVFGILQCLKAR